MSLISSVCISGGVDQVRSELGQILGVKQIAEYTGLDRKTVRKCYHQLGGIRVESRILFFEKEFIHAIQKRPEVVCPGPQTGAKTGTSVLDQEGSGGLGSRDEMRSLIKCLFKKIDPATPVANLKPAKIYEYNWLPMTRELRKSMLWWWENRPIKDKPHVFLCLAEIDACREYFGKPCRFRLHFMQRHCERTGVKVFGFHAIRHLSASLLYELWGHL